MIVYSLQPCPSGWRVLRDGQQLAQYTSARKALEIARAIALREKERHGVHTEVRPIATLAPRMRRAD